MKDGVEWKRFFDFLKVYIKLYYPDILEPAMRSSIFFISSLEA